MSSSTVNVLTPNGRRMNVKVQPNMTILKVRMRMPPIYVIHSDNLLSLICADS